jgi:hypothetical protein
MDIDRNKTKRNNTKQNKTNRNKAKRNETKRNDVRWNELSWTAIQEVKECGGRFRGENVTIESHIGDDEQVEESE